MTPRTEDNPGSQDMILGEMRGQLRELVHNVNNLSAKMDGLSREVIGLGVLATEIADIKSRLILLERTDLKREGVAGLVSIILKSPVVPWVFGAITVIWAIATKRLHL